MTARVLITAQCARRYHRLARVVAGPGGLVIEVNLSAGVHAATATGIGRGRGTRGFSEPFEPHMSYIATCDCGGGHLLDCAALACAINAGESRIVVPATL